MYSHGGDVAECMIRSEITDWFTKIIIEKCGSDINIRYKSNDGHFNTHTHVEIRGRENQTMEAFQFIQYISEIVTYKMPWLNENTYFVKYVKEKEIAEDKLNSIKNTDHDVNYICTRYHIIGNSFTLFNFRSDLDTNKKLEIDEIFKSLARRVPLFITHPKRRTQQNQSSTNMETRPLTALHGQFLQYLSLEDILSLELANSDSSACDMSLEHDIQKFLRDRFPKLYGGPKIVYWNLREFRTQDVLCHFIHKYHDRLTKIFIPNVLTVDEIQLLAASYNIQIEHHKTTHIDFKPANEKDSADFCAIYHLEPEKTYFLNYEPINASQNYSINFNVDNTFGPLNCPKEFSYFVLKSQNNCSMQKISAVLRYVIENFKVSEKDSEMILFRFNLNHMPSEIFKSLLRFMYRGLLKFEQMNFKLTSLIEILQQCDENWVVFHKCTIVVHDVETISNNSKLTYLRFADMDVELNVISILKNIGRLIILNCRILNINFMMPINMEIGNEIFFEHASFDVTILLRLLETVRCVPKLFFISCNLTSDDLIESKHFTVQNNIRFFNMIFKVQTLLQIFENCEFQSVIAFENCHFPLTNYAQKEFNAKPVKVAFYYTKFDSSALLTVLQALNKKSQVYIIDSSIIGLCENVVPTNEIIQIDYIKFENCRLEMYTLIKIFGKMSRETKVRINNCDLLHSTMLYQHVLTDLLEIIFCDVILSLQDLFDILGLLKPKSSLVLRKCHLIGESEQFSETIQESDIQIHFQNMRKESQIVRSLLQINAVIFFDDCMADFILNVLTNVSIRPHVIFCNTTFSSSEHLKWLEKFTSDTIIEFRTCHFKNIINPNFLAVPQSIIFISSTFTFESLFAIMSGISGHTQVKLVQCIIRSRLYKIPVRSIKIPIIHFERMQKFEIETIISILGNFTNLENLYFSGCNIVCSHPNKLSDINLKTKKLLFEHMNIDIQIFQTLVQKCINGTIVYVDGCKILPLRDKILSNVSVDIERLIFLDIKYSPEFLQILQCLNGRYTFECYSELSNRAITELCTQTPVHGEQLQLMTRSCTQSIYFEIFVEFFRPIALDFEVNTNVKYDLPTHLLPHINSLHGDSQYWNEFKIRFIAVNDASVKLEFIKNGTPIDFFYELNDILDDSAEWVVDN